MPVTISIISETLGNKYNYNLFVHSAGFQHIFLTQFCKAALVDIISILQNIQQFVNRILSNFICCSREKITSIHLWWSILQPVILHAGNLKCLKIGEYDPIILLSME